MTRSSPEETSTFVTGATGVVGGAFVRLLLAETFSGVCLLLRAQDDAELDRRLDALRDDWQLERERIGERLTAVRGDTTQAHFGLERTAWLARARETTHVVHAAGLVRLNLPLDDARRAIVESAKNVAAFAREGQRSGVLKKVEFVSTVGVGGRRNGELPETWLTEERRFHNTYEEAKAEAEDFIRGEIQQGLPVTVHRPSMVVGDSRTGGIASFQVFYHLLEFLSGARTRGLQPRVGRARLDIIPSDFVGRALLVASRTPETAGRVLHLCSGPESIPLASLRERLRALFSEAGRPVPPAFLLPSPVFRGLLPVLSLFAPPRVRSALSTLPIFLDYLGEEQSFANRETMALFSSLGLTLPCPEDYLDVVIRYYLASQATRNRARPSRDKESDEPQHRKKGRTGPARNPLPSAFELEIARALPRVLFGKWPTPVQRLDRLSDRLGVELWVKRDDLSGEEYGGNRVRQMEWLLAEVERRGNRRIVTFGGVGSNYIVAVAAYARRLGIRCDAIMVHQPLTNQVRRNLLLAKHFGARIHYARTFLGAAVPLLRELMGGRMREGAPPFVVRPGASTPLGSLGYVFGALELAAQIRRGECPVPDRLFVATSSCGTTAGLLAGISLSGLNIPMTGVRVVEQYVANPPHIRWLTGRVLEFVRRYAPEAYAASTRSIPDFTLCHDFFGGEYGRPQAAGEEAVAVARDEAGLTLEGTYTGKTFAAVLAWSQLPENRGRQVLFWNTYNSVDFSDVLSHADWHELPRRLWKYFDGSIPFAEALAV